MNAQMLGSRNAPGRSRPWRAMAVAALAVTAMLVAACGGGKSPSSASGSTQYQKALAFSKCMRSHGALGFPDPTSAGTITVTQALLSNQQVRTAVHSCKVPRGAVQVPAALQRKLANQALAFAACMRSHGVPSFPDPTIHDGQIGFHFAVRAGSPGAPAAKASGASSNKASGSSGPSSGGGADLPPQMQAAQRACQHLMPNG